MRRLTCAINIAAVLAVAGGAAHADLVGHWTFDDEQNLGADSSPMGNDLVPLNDPNSDVDDPVGTENPGPNFDGENAIVGSGSASFDGEDDIFALTDDEGNFDGSRVPDGVPTGDSGFTISMWTRSPEPSGGFAGQQSMFSMGEPFTGNNTWNMIRQSNTSNDFLLSNWSGDNLSVNTGTDFHSGDWNQVALSYDQNAGRRTLWVNGEAVAQDNPPAPNITAEDFTIGRAIAGFGAFWQGNLDDFRIYDESIGGAGIATLPGLPDQLTATVDRETGELSLNNPANNDETFTIKGYEAFSQTSEAFDASAFTPIAGNKDVNGDGSIDSDDVWQQMNAEADNLAEVTLGETELNPGTSINLGQVWQRSVGVLEDLEVEVLFADGDQASIPIGFNGPTPADADFDLDGDIDLDDFDILASNLFSEFDDATAERAAYLGGDLNLDGEVQVDDFLEFRELFAAAPNGMDASALPAAIPEPASAALLTLGGLIVGGRRRRRS